MSTIRKALVGVGIHKGELIYIGPKNCCMSPSKINWHYKISAKDRNNSQGWEAQIGSKFYNNYIDSSATNMTHECRLLDKQMNSNLLTVQRLTVTAHSSNGGSCITSEQKCMPYSNLVLPKRCVTMYFFPKHIN
jgi:hypothetical protein